MDYLNKLEIYLNKNGLKMTAPRKVIIECLDDLSSHFTLDDLLNAVEKRRSGVGQATLYLLAAVGMFLDVWVYWSFSYLYWVTSQNIDEYFNVRA